VKPERECWATSCIFSILNNITYVFIYRKTMSSEQVNPNILKNEKTIIGNRIKRIINLKYSHIRHKCNTPVKLI
jgi:hypothetical protein